MAITADEVFWTLAEIKAKVRKLTGRPSTNQLSSDEADKYINRFYTQDLISMLSLSEVESWWRFETMVNVPNYSNISANFVLNGPIYINGEPISIFRDPASFYAQHPMLFKTRESVGTGDGSTVTFTGTLGKTIINPENMVFDDDSEALRVKSRSKITGISSAATAVITTELAHGLTTGDVVKIMDLTQGMVGINNVQTTVTVNTNTAFQLDNIDTSNATEFPAYTSGGNVYPISVAILAGDQGGSGRVTLSSGAYSITFNTAPTNNQALIASYEFSNAARPIAALFYDNEILFSPVPDASYFIQIAVSGRPAPLLADTDGLASDDWGKLVAYGAAIDIMNDNGQQEGADIMQKQFRQLQMQALNRTLQNLSSERALPRF